MGKKPVISNSRGSHQTGLSGGEKAKLCSLVQPPKAAASGDQPGKADANTPGPAEVWTQRRLGLPGKGKHPQAKTCPRVKPLKGTRSSPKTTADANTQIPGAGDGRHADIGSTSSLDSDMGRFGPR